MDARIPPFLQGELLRVYGAEEAERIAAGFVHRPVTLRVNTLKTDAQAVRQALDGAGIRWEAVPWYPDALVLPGVREEAVRGLPMYEAGEIYLQSLSSMLPPLLMRLAPGMSVLDMCAAPGGKTCEIAALTGGQADITACEFDRIRADRLRANLARQGVRRAVVLEQDARRLDDLFRFDAVLLDAPCSGSGTIDLSDGAPPRRMDADWVRRLTRTQTALLRKALDLLKPGCEMVYSTCSILPMENGGVVRSAAEAAGAEILPVPPSLADALPLLPQEVPGAVCIRPTERFEGFFAARIGKTKKARR